VAGEIDPDEARGSVVIVDYGCAQGRVSNTLIGLAGERVRRSWPEAPIYVYHNDLLSNDWEGLFERLRGGDSYLQIAGGPITPLVSATSFYEPVTPPHLVDLGISFAAAQWLASPGPAGSGTALYFDQLDGDARAEMAAQAHRDWTRFLELRADELAPGGRLIINMMAVPEGGSAAGHDLWREVRAICAELADEGEFDARRLDAYVVPVYERSTAEVSRPFDEEIGRRLRLESLELRAVANPIAERFRRDGDADAFGRDFTAFFRAWSEPSLEQALAPSGGGLDRLYRRLEVRLRETVADFRFEVHAATALIAAVRPGG
jgi:hypothetical protein